MKRVCTKCGIEKPISEFAKKKTGKYGVKAYCKVCQRADGKRYHAENREEILKRRNEYRYGYGAERYRANKQRYEKKYRKENPEKIAKWDKRGNVRRLFGLTLDEYELLMGERICEICGDSEADRYHLDHCHNTGRVRGCLCSRCNLMLGQAKDNIEILQAGIDYLKKYSG